jgi:hypothetical protein
MHSCRIVNGHHAWSHTIVLAVVSAIWVSNLREPSSVLGREALSHMSANESMGTQVTDAPYGHILTNINVWSPDSQWIVYDIRSDAAGEIFDGPRIERVNVVTGQVQVLYEAARGAHCGVVTYHPKRDEVIFIAGPENPTPAWKYAANHRRGVIVRVRDPSHPVNLDARDLVTPFTPGALRGGSHVHVFSPDGDWVSFTYQDHVLSQFERETDEHDNDLRNVGVSVPAGPVRVSRTHPRNHDGQYFTVLVTDTTDRPEPGSDQIKKAYEDAWVGKHGYLRPTGQRQLRALAFQGDVVTDQGQTITEAFIADLPDDLTTPGDGPLAGTATRRPFPPKGVRQRRLTHTANRKFPGLQGPRHWLRSSPDGTRIAMLMKDDHGIVQLWTVSPNGGPPSQVTDNPWSVASAFSWSPDGRYIAHVMDNSVCVTELDSGHTVRITPRTSDELAPRPEACVFSPDGRRIAFVRTVPMNSQGTFNQVFVVPVKNSDR